MPGIPGQQTTAEFLSPETKKTCAISKAPFLIRSNHGIPKLKCLKTEKRRTEAINAVPQKLPEIYQTPLSRRKLTSTGGLVERTECASSSENTVKIKTKKVPQTTTHHRNENLQSHRLTSKKTKKPKPN
jgi:hypothetical protein